MSNLDLNSTLDFTDEQVKLALKFATEKHKGQFRESGEEYITHPVWVAKVVAQLGVGQEAVIAALLHDCIEDTNTTEDEIANIFGDEVALLVSGMTDVKHKTSGVEILNTNVEIFRRFLFSSVLVEINLIKTKIVFSFQRCTFVLLINC